ncbi:MAG: hypothetical protein LBK27_05740 [Treponema sp.]|nr:hypothetical protein [Treponema sp.]
MQPDIQGRALSAVSDGSEMILFEKNTGNIEMRTSINTGAPQKINSFSYETSMSKVDLSHIRKEAQRLALDTREDHDSNSFEVTLPPALSNNPHEDYVSIKAVFDTARELLSRVEILSLVKNDGTKKKSTVISLYQQYQHTYIKTGQITTVENQNQNPNSQIDSDNSAYSNRNIHIVEQYSEIEINTVPNDVFQVPGGF